MRETYLEHRAESWRWRRPRWRNWPGRSRRTNDWSPTRRIRRVWTPWRANDPADPPDVLSTNKCKAKMNSSSTGRTSNSLHNAVLVIKLRSIRPLEFPFNEAVSKKFHILFTHSTQVCPKQFLNRAHISEIDRIRVSLCSQTQGPLARHRKGVTKKSQIIDKVQVLQHRGGENNCRVPFRSSTWALDAEENEEKRPSEPAFWRSDALFPPSRPNRKIVGLFNCDSCSLDIHCIVGGEKETNHSDWLSAGAASCEELSCAMRRWSCQVIEWLLMNQLSLHRPLGSSLKSIYLNNGLFSPSAMSTVTPLLMPSRMIDRVVCRLERLPVSWLMARIDFPCVRWIYNGPSCQRDFLFLFQSMWKMGEISLTRRCRRDKWRTSGRPHTQEKGHKNERQSDSKIWWNRGWISTGWMQEVECWHSNRTVTPIFLPRGPWIIDKTSRSAQSGCQSSLICCADRRPKSNWHKRGQIQWDVTVAEWKRGNQRLKGGTESSTGPLWLFYFEWHSQYKSFPVHIHSTATNRDEQKREM